MNIEPSGQQVEKWIAEASSEGGKILDPNKLAGLAAAWGAAQAQQPTVEEPDNVRHVLLAAMIDIGAVLNGNYDEDHLEKTCTKIAAILYGRAPSRAFEPELPEPVAWTYQNRYTDQHYLTWSKSDGGRNWEPLYTTAQMHAFADAKVRAGAAGSQDANEEVVTITVPLSHINSLQVESIKRLVARTKHAHMTDVRIRINGNYEYFEADWLKYVVIGGGV